ncbi:MAG: protoporphyrinogen oxidase [Thermodesulfobacteriota bacterium]
MVIIGGGIAGLSTAYSLIEHSRLKGVKDLHITLIEKSSGLGGNIKTENIDGFLVEGGPDCFLSEKPWAMELIKRLGLETSLLPTRKPRGKTFVYHKGKLHLLPEGVILMVPTRMIPLAFSSLISIQGKLRMALEFFIPKRKEKTDESLGDFVRRRLGKEALDKIAEPLVAGVHAGDPETMSVRASFPKFVELEENHGSLIRGMLARMKAMRAHTKPGVKSNITMFMTLRHGLTELISAIVSKLEGVEIKTGIKVKGVLKKGNGYEVLVEGSPSIEADSVVIAAPAYAAAELVKTLDKELSEKLLTIPYVSTATVSIGYKRKDIAHPLDGFGFIVPKIEKRKLMAATWSSIKWEGRAPEDSVLIRCFIGGAKNEELVSLNDKEMTDVVRSELKEIMGIDAEPLFVRVFRWIKAMPQYTIGHETRVLKIEELAGKHSGLYLTGSAFKGIGISDTVREGEVTAKKVLKLLEH